MNRLLQEIMRSNIQADQNNWLELLDGAVMAINNAPIELGRKSPFELEHGYEMKVPYDVQSLQYQAWQNRGDALLVRDTMEFRIRRPIPNTRSTRSSSSTRTRSLGSHRAQLPSQRVPHALQRGVQRQRRVLLGEPEPSLSLIMIVLYKQIRGHPSDRGHKAALCPLSLQ